MRGNRGLELGRLTEAETIRSVTRSDFVTSGCIEYDDGPNTTATDATNAAAIAVGLGDSGLRGFKGLRVEGWS